MANELIALRQAEDFGLRRVARHTGQAETRTARDAARTVLVLGDNPAEWVKLDRIAATVTACNSFKATADGWLPKVEKDGR